MQEKLEKVSFSKKFLEYQILCREKFIQTRIRILAPGMACCHALRSTIHELQFAGLDYRKPFSFPFFLQAVGSIGLLNDWESQ